jgi:hypothetical protein
MTKWTKPTRPEKINSIAPAAEKSVSGYASPAEGYLALLNSEGGCMAVDDVRKLLGGGIEASRQAVHDRIKRGTLLAAKTPLGQYAIPRWQFEANGAVLDGLPETIRMLKECYSGYTPLTAFAFFLQPAPALDFKTPLSVLRSGEVQRVRNAAKKHCEQ